MLEPNKDDPRQFEYDPIAQFEFFKQMAYPNTALPAQQERQLRQAHLAGMAQLFVLINTASKKASDEDLALLNKMELLTYDELIRVLKS